MCFSSAKSSNISVLSLNQIYRRFIYLLTSRRNFLSWLTRSFQVTLSLSTPFNVSQENVSRFVLRYRIHASLQINLAIGRGLKSSKLIHITPPLRAEIQHWADPSVVARVGNWRSERHHQFVIYSDASLFAWGGVFPKESRVCISDYWPASLVDLDINVKETKALSNTLFSFGDKLRDARVDAYVDNQALVRAWQSQAARSSSFSDALKELSNTVLSLNLHLSVLYVPSRENPADHPSRRLSPADSKLAQHLWLRLQSHPCFGASDGHSVDLMALDSNAQSDGDGAILPHFTPYPTPLSSGVDFFGQDYSQSFLNLSDTK